MQLGTDAYKESGRLTAHNGRRSPSLSELALAMENSSNPSRQIITAKAVYGTKKGHETNLSST